MAFVLLAFEFEYTKNSYMLDMPQGLWEGKVMVVALVGPRNLVVLKIQVAGEDCKVLKQPLHQLDLFEVSLVLVVVVVNPI